MKICIQHGELRHELTDKEHDLEDFDNSAINNIIEVCHQNSLDIQGLVKYIAGIKKII